ncbi:MAG: hypothetical protein HY335_05955 [Deinococcus sp.]|nr:hypothetical protein [Deinococcus sp.]
MRILVAGVLAVLLGFPVALGVDSQEVTVDVVWGVESAINAFNLNAWGCAMPIDFGVVNIENSPKDSGCDLVYQIDASPAGSDGEVRLSVRLAASMPSGSSLKLTATVDPGSSGVSEGAKTLSTASRTLVSDIAAGAVLSPAFDSTGSIDLQMSATATATEGSFSAAVLFTVALF